MADSILEVVDLHKHFPVKAGFFKKVVGWVRAVNGVEFSVDRGKTTAIVGESGSGKTTTAKLILRLIDPTKGKIVFKGIEISQMKEKELRPLRKHFQMVFQNPYSSLNPRLNVFHIVAEPLFTHEKVSRAEAVKRVQETLELVGLPPDSLFLYPHEFSGGEKQRISIARAIILKPELMVLDEPVSSLDVSIRSQILNLFKDIQKKFSTSYVFISHDLSTTRFIADKLLVMYRGYPVEYGSSESVFTNPLHPYTKLLFSSVPEKMNIDEKVEAEVEEEGACPFYHRCPHRSEKCRVKIPEKREVSKEHLVWCFNA